MYINISHPSCCMENGLPMGRSRETRPLNSQRCWGTAERGGEARVKDGLGVRRE